MSTYSGILQRAIVPPSTAHCEGVGHMSPPAVASVGSRQHESVVVNASIESIPGRSVLRRPNPLFDAPDATLSPLNDPRVGRRPREFRQQRRDRPPTGRSDGPHVAVRSFGTRDDDDVTARGQVGWRTAARRDIKPPGGGRPIGGRGIAQFVPANSGCPPPLPRVPTRATRAAACAPHLSAAMPDVSATGDTQLASFLVAPHLPTWRRWYALARAVRSPESNVDADARRALWRGHAGHASVMEARIVQLYVATPSVRVHRLCEEGQANRHPPTRQLVNCCGKTPLRRQRALTTAVWRPSRLSVEHRPCRARRYVRVTA
jgi:hypothetical protein